MLFNIRSNLYLLLGSIFFVISACSNLEFVYKTTGTSFKIKDKVYTYVDGTDSTEIYNYLRSKIGSASSDNHKYKMIIKSRNVEKAEIIDKDATASKFSVEYIFLYNFYNTEKNCKVFEKEFSTKDFYDSKSEGYSFGTDFSKNELSKKLIQKNIDNLVSLINEMESLDKCQSEN